VTTEEAPCPICSLPASFDPSNGRLRWKCKRCGEFIMVSEPTEDSLRQTPLPNSGAASAWVRLQNASRIIPSIADADYLRRLSKPSFVERAERYLQRAIQLCPRLDSQFDPNDESLIGASASDDKSEKNIIMKYLFDEKYLRKVGDKFKIDPRGYIKADGLRTKRAKVAQTFVAMSFSQEMNDAYEKGLKVGIQSAGFSPLRIDSIEHTNKIDDEIIAEIRRSAFVVADFTGQRPSVYYEAGFAMGLGLRVIWTCRKGDLQDLHFDTRQYNFLAWETPEELADRLRKRIVAVIGQGPAA
jgi:nucleoside 2-deoxyribosyltransferase